MRKWMYRRQAQQRQKSCMIKLWNLQRRLKAHATVFYYDIKEIIFASLIVLFE
jgi:hypothetical protein